MKKTTAALPLAICIISLAVLPDVIFLGTKAGLFISRDNMRSWNKQDGVIGSVPILSIDFNTQENNYIYLVSINGVLRSSDSGKSWEKIFLMHAVENDSQESRDTVNQDTPERYSDMRFLKIDPQHVNYLYLATAKGVYKSAICGSSS